MLAVHLSIEMAFYDKLLLHTHTYARAHTRAQVLFTRTNGGGGGRGGVEGVVGRGGLFNVIALEKHQVVRCFLVPENGKLPEHAAQ